ncbi:carboxypeptidase-like regulatory domain-containing protein [Niabella sp. W65]|nr:carboxypeptidase-like regulatory domain-containing protein [Niabella sp. W65]MCH7363034.1 carboxypeptidase-like regulatory domain-containing protein [Niabella sp. W65]
MIALNNVFNILKMAMVLAFSIGVLPALCQKKVTVVGTVTDSSGVPLANVSIAVQGTGSGSQTDNNGRFVIDAPAGSTLIFFCGILY